MAGRRPTAPDIRKLCKAAKDTVCIGFKDLKGPDPRIYYFPLFTAIDTACTICELMDKGANVDTYQTHAFVLNRYLLELVANMGVILGHPDEGVRKKYIQQWLDSQKLSPGYDEGRYVAEAKYLTPGAKRSARVREQEVYELQDIQLSVFDLSFYQKIELLPV